MENNNNLQDFKDQNLLHLRRQLSFQIQRTHRYFLVEIIILLVYSILVGLFFISFITYRVNESYIIPRIFIAFLFSIFGLIEIVRIWPYLREAGHCLGQLKMNTINNKKDQETTLQFIQGINAYLNRLYFLIFQKNKSKKRFQDYTPYQLSEKLEKRLTFVMIGYIIMGFLIFGICVYLLIDYSFLLPNPIIYSSFLGIIISYSLILITSLKTRKIISYWMTGYFDLISWADNLERSPLNKKSNKFNEE